MSSIYYVYAQTLDVHLLEANIGYPIIDEQLPENYAYDPLFLTFRLPIFKNGNKKRLRYYIEPQFAYTSLPNNIPSAYEFGCNLGIQYIAWHTDNQRIVAALGVGPHYISLNTTLQHKGFLFSDNIEIGFYQRIKNRWGVQLKGRFRHLSNANLQQPNKGLDNLFILVGLNWTWN